MKRIFGVLLLAVFLFSCEIPLLKDKDDSSSDESLSDDDGTEEEEKALMPDKLSLNNPKALFIAPAAGSRGEDAGTDTSDSESTASALFQILQNGTIEAVAFTLSDGTIVDLDVKAMNYLSEEYIALRIQLKSAATAERADEEAVDTDESGSSDDFMPRNILVEKSSGKVYDFKSYLLINDTLSSYYSSPFVLDNTLYVLSTTDLGDSGTGTLYRINLATKAAEPMNNPQYLSIDRFYHVGSGDFLVYDSISQKSYLLLHDGSAPVLADQTQYESEENNPLSEMGTLSGGLMDTIPFIYDLKGNLYDLDRTFIQDFSNGSAYYANLFSQISFSSSATGLIMTKKDMLQVEVESGAYSTLCSSYGVNDRSRAVICKSGYVIMSANDNGGGGFNYLCGKKDLSSLMSKTLSWYDSIAFYVDSGVLKKWNIAEDDAPSNLISDQRVNTAWVVNGEIYYTVYASATAVQTWKMDSAGTKTKVSDSQMQMQQIVEFVL